MIEAFFIFSNIGKLCSIHQYNHLGLCDSELEELSQNALAILSGSQPFVIVESEDLFKDTPSSLSDKLICLIKREDILLAGVLFEESELVSFKVMNLIIDELKEKLEKPLSFSVRTHPVLTKSVMDSFVFGGQIMAVSRDESSKIFELNYKVSEN